MNNIVTKSVNVLLMCGLPTSGKTTLAKKISEKFKNYEIISLDQYLMKFFDSDSLDTISEVNRKNGVAICREQTLNKTKNNVLKKINTIVDDGFFADQVRKDWIEQLRLLGADCKVIYKKITFKTACSRLSHRHTLNTKTVFEISPDRWLELQHAFEPPTVSSNSSTIVLDEEMSEETCLHKICIELTKT